MIKFFIKEFKDMMSALGEMSIILAKGLLFLMQGKINIRDLVYQMSQIGVDSLFMVSITGLSTGMVLVVQMGNQMVKMGAESYVGGIVALSLARELAPNLTAIVVAGRIGSSIAAEIGTMAVTEQIDALYTLAVSPIKYLVVPRVLAAALMLPILTIFTNMIGIAGGSFVAVAQVNISLMTFKESILTNLAIRDVMGGLIKSFFFGGIIGLVGCYKGFKTYGGAEGVGKSTTGAVVLSIMLILVSNYFLSVLIVNFNDTFLSK
ncbi:MAG TPA: ABC transporter permease [Candidatus Wallbacteria bacterium]|nr:ABC transporter permease [Candidatus Wallbacteria bacterium]